MISKLRQLWMDIRRARFLRKQNSRLISLKQLIFKQARLRENIDPIVFYNASTRITGLSLNAAFSLLTSWSMRLEGVPIHYLVCFEGMSKCVLGTNRRNLHSDPPCQKCIHQSQVIYDQESAHRIHFSIDPIFDRLVDSLSLDQMTSFVYDQVPLGQLVLPSIRWILRRHNLVDDEDTRALYKEYLRSAWNTAREMQKFLTEIQPQAIVVFNGMFFPEATVKWIARNQDIRVISHEVGLQPMTGFFTDGEATAYPIDIPEDFQLDRVQNIRLDSYLDRRFQGDFTMAGIRFWSSMKTIDQRLQQRIASFKQMVPVFTNVIFDTSQPHSNVVFRDMFHWLETVVELAEEHPDTLFIIRAHPDESRPGKASQESVREWIQAHDLLRLPNIDFIDSEESLSSYGLIQAGKFTMVYNSSIGLEASIMGQAVLCGGQARYTQLPTVFSPTSIEDFRQNAQEMLTSSEVGNPEKFVINARRFLYYQLFRVSLPFEEFLGEGIYPGFVSMGQFSLDALSSHRSKTMKTLRTGILNGDAFEIDE